MKQIIKNIVGAFAFMLLGLFAFILIPFVILLFWYDEKKYPAKFNHWPWEKEFYDFRN